jgi:mannose-6-phosphate isomerase-like protein (cupin superfamily)
VKHKIRNSIIVKDNDLGNGRSNKVVHVKGRFPKNGCANSSVSSQIVYAMKGSGKFTTATRKEDVRPGSAMIINSGECFYLKGQFSLYFLPIK